MDTKQREGQVRAEFFDSPRGYIHLPPFNGTLGHFTSLITKSVPLRQMTDPRGFQTLYERMAKPRKIRVQSVLSLTGVSKKKDMLDLTKHIHEQPGIRACRLATFLQFIFTNFGDVSLRNFPECEVCAVTLSAEGFPYVPTVKLRPISGKVFPEYIVPHDAILSPDDYLIFEEK